MDGTGAAGAKEGASTEGEESAKQDGVAAAEPSVPSATEIDAVLASGIAALEAQAKKELTDTVRQFMVDLTLPLGMRLTDFFEDGVNPCSMVTIVRSGGQCDAAGVEAGCKILSVDGNDVKTLLEVKYALEDCVKRGESRCAIEYSKMEVEPIAMLTELREGKKRKTRLRIPSSTLGRRPGAPETARRETSRKIPKRIAAELDDDHPDDENDLFGLTSIRPKLRKRNRPRRRSTFPKPR